MYVRVELRCAECFVVATLLHDYLELFPLPFPADSTFQLKAQLSTDLNFKGEWMDVGGVVIDFNDLSPLTLEDALTDMDPSVGLSGYYVVNPVTNGGKGQVSTPPV